MLVGASGSILTKQMADAMNRSIANVFFAGVGTGGGGALVAPGGGGTARSTSAADVAIQLSYARLVVVVPGYGMAVAQAQRAVADLATELEKRGVEVLYAIHPVAGRMPGHMNVLLAEADVPYDKLKEMDDINGEFGRTDVSLVIGANDVTNPAARTVADSPIYGMPILDVDKSGSVIVLKRSDEQRLRGHRQPALLRPEDGDALRRRQDLGERHPLRGPGTLRTCSSWRRHQDQLREEIADLMEQVMESMGVGTMVIPDEIQRGMMETAAPVARRRRAARAARRPQSSALERAPMSSGGCRSPTVENALHGTRPPARTTEGARRRRRAPCRGRLGR